MFLPCVIFPWREDEYVPFCYGIKQAVAGDSCGYNDTSYLIVHEEIKGVWKAAPWKLGMRCVYRLCLLSPNWIRDQFLHHYWEWQGSLTKAHDLELQGSRGIFPHPSMPCQTLANAICRARSLFYTHLRAKVRKIIDICKFIFVFCAFSLLTFVAFHFLFLWHFTSYFCGMRYIAILLVFGIGYAKGRFFMPWPPKNVPFICTFQIFVVPLHPQRFNAQFTDHEYYPTAESRQRVRRTMGGKGLRERR